MHGVTWTGQSSAVMAMFGDTTLPTLALPFHACVVNEKVPEVAPAGAPSSAFAPGVCKASMSSHLLHSAIVMIPWHCSVLPCGLPGKVS